MTEPTGRPTPRGGNWWPLALIAIGVVILAGNLGLGLGPVWRFLGDLLAYWPVALIAFGADMLTHGRYRLLIASIAIGVVVVLAAYGSRGGETISIQESAAGATSARVVLDVGVSPLRLSTAQGGDLVRGTVSQAAGERVEHTASLRNGRAEVTIRARQRSWVPFSWGGGRGGLWDLTLARGVPTELVIDGGVGNIELDLTEARLTSLEVDSGVGSLTLTLPRSGGFQGEIDGGVGSVTLLVPEGLALTLEVDTGIGSVRVGSGFERNGNVYTSPAAAAGLSPVARLRLDVGVGSVDVRTVR